MKMVKCWNISRACMSTEIHLSSFRHIQSRLEIYSSPSRLNARRNRRRRQLSLKKEERNPCFAFPWTATMQTPARRIYPVRAWASKKNDAHIYIAIYKTSCKPRLSPARNQMGQVWRWRWKARERERDRSKNRVKANVARRGRVGRLSPLVLADGATRRCAPTRSY